MQILPKKKKKKKKSSSTDISLLPIPQLGTLHMFESHFVNRFQFLAQMPFSLFSQASDNVLEVSSYMKSNEQCHQLPLIWLFLAHGSFYLCEKPTYQISGKNSKPFLRYRCLVPGPFWFILSEERSKIT